MKVIEEHWYNGCTFAGGPWRDTVADSVDSDTATEIARQWRDTIRSRIAALPSERFNHSTEELNARWHFAPESDVRQMPGFQASRYKELELISYGSPDERYTLILQKTAMKGLSLHPEAAWSMLIGDKTIECRRAPTAYRGPVLICASSTKQPILINRHAICVATLADVVPFEKQHLKPAMMSTMPTGKYYAWKFDNILPIQPFPIKGTAGLFDVGDLSIKYMYVPQVNSMNIDQFCAYAEKFYLAYYFPLVYTDNPNLDGFIAATGISTALRENTDLLFADDPLPPEVASTIGDTYKRFINGNKPN